MTTAGRREVAISQVVIDEDTIEAVVAVLRSGQLRQGPVCRAFEEEFAATVGSEHAVTAASGTAALHMAYQALLQPGDEVLVPAFTFCATASMILAVGAVPVFCDVDAQTLTLDPDDAAQRVTPRTRAIAPVHIFGNPVDVPAVQQLGRRHGLRIIWDAAQAHGAHYDGRDVGSYDDAVCYSFYPSKNMTTGEGGMICTNDEQLAGRLRRIRSHGESEKYRHAALGYNFRMTDLQAALGRGQLRRLAGSTEQRRKNAAYLRHRFAACDRVSMQKEQPNGAHSYHQFTVRVGEPIDRDRLLLRLREAGVGAAVHYPIPLHHQPLFADEAGHVSLPVSQDAARRVISLPVHPHLSADDLCYVADRLLEGIDAS